MIEAITRKDSRVQKKIRKRKHQNRTKKRKAGRFDIDKWYLRVEYFDWECRYCGKKLDASTLTVDHQIPVSRGGTNLPANLVPACEQCNSFKGNRTPQEFKRFLKRNHFRELKWNQTSQGGIQPGSKYTNKTGKKRSR